MQPQFIKNAYRRYAPYYDLIFGKILQGGRHSAMKIINTVALQNAAVLEVGVGTGLSLPHYRSDIHITGTDLSIEMLQKAKERVNELQLANRVQLLEMDAEKMAFPDHHFDGIMALYVASVVSNVQQFLEEINRVCKPGGDIIIVNHFASEHTLIKTLEKKLSRLQGWLGFHSHLPLSAVSSFPAFELIDLQRTNLFGYWKLLHFKKK